MPDFLWRTTVTPPAALLPQERHPGPPTPSPQHRREATSKPSAKNETVTTISLSGSAMEIVVVLDLGDQFFPAPGGSRHHRELHGGQSEHRPESPTSDTSAPLDCAGARPGQAWPVGPRNGCRSMSRRSMSRYDPQSPTPSRPWPWPHTPELKRAVFGLWGVGRSGVVPEPQGVL